MADAEDNEVTSSDGPAQSIIDVVPKIELPSPPQSHYHAPAAEIPPLTPEPTSPAPPSPAPIAAISESVERPVTPLAAEKATLHPNGSAVNGVPSAPESVVDDKPTTPAPEEPAALPTPAPEPVPVAQAPVATQTQTPPVSTPAPPPTVPSGPKTWASLAATNNRKWGSAMSQDVRGVSAAAIPSSSPSTPQSQPPTHRAQNNLPASKPDAQSTPPNLSNPQCFVKVRAVLTFLHSFAYLFFITLGRHRKRFAEPTPGSPHCPLRSSERNRDHPQQSLRIH